MSLKLEHLSFFANLRDGLNVIQADLGSDWEQFSGLLLSLVEQLKGAKDDRARNQVFSQIINHLLTVSERSDYVFELLAGPRTKGSGPGPGWESQQQSWPGGGLATVSRWRRAEELTDAGAIREALNVFSEALASDLKDLSAVADEKQEPTPRYFNAFFTKKENKQTVTADEPLYKRPYFLNVEIHPEKRGPGGDDKFVDDALADAYKDDDMISLLVVASSRDFEIKPRVRTIELPRVGPSTTAIFSATPFVADQRAIVKVEIFYRGHLLQAKRIEALVLSDESSDPPISIRPYQSARITFITTDRFSTDTLTLIPERVLSIEIERDERDQSVDLRFLDRTNGEAELVFYDTNLAPQALGEAVRSVREKLKTVVKGEQRNGRKVQGYEWMKKATDAMLLEWLPHLADVGRSLYRALLPDSQRRSLSDEGERLKAALRPGAEIQINPIAGRVTVPWTLLYERPVFLHPAENKICKNYWTDGPDCPECEAQSDPRVICPSAFWGFRYAIEQLPGWVANELPNPLALLRRISNGKPLLLNLNVWRRFNFWRDHLKKLEAAGEIHTALAEDLTTVATTWKSRARELDILYFYTHGGIEQREPYLEVSDGRITSNTLESTLGAGTLSHSPLVFLNGCATGDYGPESFVSLIDDFRGAGACGVIGTECAIPELFAEEYAAKLFPRLFRGERLGQAMLELRREFLTEYKNPLALVYSLYASNEISLTSPVNKS